MKYDVVIIPETFHKFGKHDMEHVCVPLVIEDRSYDIAVEIVNGIDKVLRANFTVTVEEPEGDDCDVLYRRYTIEKGEKKGILHVKLRRIAENCPPIDGNRCSVLEFERDVECIVNEIKECLA
ncbi:hypothetical protein [Thermococcus sp.]|uniref:hypothetical protein n=1 Tax=Thermococcus sp. TaxID=35749 RepID=UPI0025D53E6A|nr:hypothetical protein [Thermococcus sp.]